MSRTIHTNGGLQTTIIVILLLVATYWVVSTFWPDVFERILP